MATRAPSDNIASGVKVLHYLFAEVIGQRPASHIELWTALDDLLSETTETNVNGIVPVKLDLRHLQIAPEILQFRDVSDSLRYGGITRLE
jgi:hypothetical protein